MRLNASDFMKGSTTGGIQEALAAMPGWGEVVVDHPACPSTTVQWNRIGIDLVIEEHILCSPLLTGVFLEMTASDCSVYGNSIRSGISGAGCSAIMALPGADKCGVFGLHIDDYNRSGTNGHAGIFAFGYPTPINNFTVSGCHISNGKGGAIRGGMLIGFNVEGNWVGYNQAPSAELINIFGSKGRIRKNLVVNGLVTGIMVYGGPMTDYSIEDNEIINCSQAVLAGQVGSNSAIELCIFNPGPPATGSSLGRFVIKGNKALDNQAKPTMQQLLSITDGGVASTFSDGYIGNNEQVGCLSTAQISYQIQSNNEMVNCVVLS